MRTFLISILIAISISTVAFADVPAVGFYVLKTKDLKTLTPENGNLENIDILKLEDISTARGYFEGDCSIYFKTKDYQHRIKAFNKDGELDFSFNMYSQKDKKQIFSSKGQVKLKKQFTAKQNWQNEEYVVLFRRQNLSK